MILGIRLRLRRTIDSHAPPAFGPADAACYGVARPVLDHGGGMRTPGPSGNDGPNAPLRQPSTEGIAVIDRSAIRYRTGVPTVAR